ncbi:MAG: 5-(carboxyamino)imidazole ribonucleotide mutase [Gammaproteobacteria bacterium]|nr:5-(carboxyamino)imidazole ribonucleotide mutase [Gammaproteobacteria bacterium]
MNMNWVAILMGSNSDWPVVKKTTLVLDKFGIEFEVRVTSAHRTPHQTAAYVEDAVARGCSVFICAAGLAAHLAGVVAAHTTRPVIGIPIDGGPLSGVDSLYSTVQMPGGVPVATVAIGSAGAKNAGFLAAQILALSNDELAQKLTQDRQNNIENVMAQNQSVQEDLE